ncbi:hypothetical protein LJC61_08235 [Ruminococcaceae bacterium OttesenSCG-928-A16]|nr:hypothetical protein [Ruminococcaceae bacterium OttesenSCG-928-A16]
MNLSTAFVAYYGRQPRKEELEDPAVIKVLRKEYKQLALPESPQKANLMLRDFPEVKGENGVLHFGGNQMWFARKTQRLAGCGPVAAANVLASLARQNPAVAAALNLHFLQGSQISQPSYLQFMQRVYQTMRTLEIPLLNHLADASAKEKPKIPPSLGRGAAGFASGILRFAAKNGVALKAHTLLPGFSPYNKGLHFIMRGLQAGTPVVLLTARNKHTLWQYNQNVNATPQKAQALHSHFVTVAGVRPGPQGPQLLVSSWGRMFVIEYTELHQSWQWPTSVGAALLYFTMGESLQQTTGQVIASYGILPATMAKTVVGTLGLPLKLLAKPFKTTGTPNKG